MATVTLKITQRVTYSKTFDMPDEMYEAIKSNLDTMRGRELAAYEERIAEKYIDFQDDVLDADDTELLEFKKESK